jgi:hypothetical protein
MYDYPVFVTTSKTKKWNERWAGSALFLKAPGLTEDGKG